MRRRTDAAGRVAVLAAVVTAGLALSPEPLAAAAIPQHVAAAVLPRGGSAFSARRPDAAAVPLAAQVPAPAPVTQEPADSTRGGPRDPAELEAFIDGIMAALLPQTHTAGAVVHVVRGGEPFFSRGYGYADRASRTPVDPATTLFRIGSVSKLFVWIGVMQMVEQGRLDLDADVNGYLDFVVPATFEKPVTLADIMAHAGGFEDRVIRLFGEDSTDVRPLGELLAEQLPARVRPAGDIASYSNHATGLAAYIVERAAGTEWKEHIERTILAPLGMHHTTFRQPLPEALAPDMSKGYSWDGARYREEDFEYVPLAPVGAAAASATDMGRLMSALLAYGALGDARILREETARAMLTDHHRMQPGVNGMAHGFMVSSRNGQRIVGHGGDTRFFHTGLWLFPGHDLGVFVSFNSADGATVRGRFFDAFVDRYFPVEEPVPAPPEDFADRAGRFTGEWMANRFSHTTIAKLGRGSVNVTATPRGTLRALNAEWVEVAPLTFREESGPRTMIFRENDAGDVTHFFLAGTPIVAWERVPPIERAGLQVALLGIAIATMALTLLAPIAGWVARRWHRVPAAQVVRIPAAARWTLRAAAALFAVAALAIAALASGSRGAGVPAALPVVLALPIVAALLTLAAAFFAVRLWLRRLGRPAIRLLYSAAVLGLCLFLWQLSVWNLLGWNY